MERMQSLITIALLDSSYISEKLAFNAGTFTGLKQLELIGLPDLQVVKFEDRAVRRIRKIFIRSCKVRLFGRMKLKKLRDSDFDVDSGVEVVN